MNDNYRKAIVEYEKEVTKDIIEMYKNDNSLEGFIKIFNYIKHHTFGVDYYNQILEKNEVTSFFEQEEISIIKNIVLQFRSHQYLQSIINEYNANGFTVNNSSLFDQFYEYVIYKPELFSFERYFQKDRTTITDIKNKYDEFLTFKKEKEEKRRAQSKEIYEKIMKNYEINNNIDQTVAYIRDELKVGHIKLFQVRDTLKPYLNKEEFQFLEKLSRKMYTFVYKDFSIIFNILNGDNIMDMLFDKGIAPSRLRSMIKSLERNFVFMVEEKKKIEEFYKEYNTYFYEKNSKSTNEKRLNYFKSKLEVSINIISEYIDGNFKSIAKYTKEKNISEEQFHHCLEVLKTLKHPLYERYNEYIKKEMSKRYATILNIARNMIDKMKNGIELESGGKRNFDLLDYYQTTSFDFEKLLNIIKNHISKEEYKIFKTFIAKYKNDQTLSTYDIYTIYRSKHMTGVSLDSEDKIIPDTGREITLEEKQKVITYLKEHKIPITNFTYDIALKRLLAGSLTIPEKDPIIKSEAKIKKK